MTKFWFRVHDDAPATATFPMFMREVAMLVFSFVQWCVHRPRGIIAIELDEVVISRPRTAWPLTYVYSVVHMRKGAPAISYINDTAGMIPAGSRVLLLGLGGGGLPYEMRSRGVDIHLTAVDVDPDALLVRTYLNELKQPHATALDLGTIFVHIGTLTRKAAYLPRTDRGITPSHPTALQLRRRRRRGGCSSRRSRRGP